MIITQIKGGLGNQLFQYALGRALAHHHQVALKIDLSWYKTNPSRQYMLDKFNINASVALDKEIRSVLGDKTIFGKVSRRIQKFLPYYRRRIIIQPSGRYNPKILNSPKNVYLLGYWASYYKCFLSITNIINKEITLVNPLNSLNEALSNEIRSKESISVHIRRGDYLDNRNINLFGVQPLEYYHKAVQFVASKLKNPFFFIFSDDIEWVRKNFNIEYPHKLVMINNSYTAYYDLIHISNCNHHINANSSFSWWGAWLGKNPDKIVVVPKHWYVDTSYNPDNFLPKEWIRL